MATTGVAVPVPVTRAHQPAVRPEVEAAEDAIIAMRRCYSTCVGDARGQVQAERRTKARSSSSSPIESP